MVGRKRDKSQTRKALLESALELISEKGYLGATTREIAMRAGVSEITLFRHFSSKERLFEQMLKQHTFLPRLKDLIPALQSLSIEDALFEIGVSFFNTLKERQGLVRIMLSEINLYPEKIRQIYTRFIEEMVDTLAGFFRSQQSRGVIRDFDAKTGARIFLGMVFSFFQSEVILQGKRIGPERVKKTLRRYVDIFLKGVMV